MAECVHRNCSTPSLVYSFSGYPPPRPPHFPAVVLWIFRPERHSVFYWGLAIYMVPSIACFQVKKFTFQLQNLPDVLCYPILSYNFLCILPKANGYYLQKSQSSRTCLSMLQGDLRLCMPDLVAMKTWWDPYADLFLFITARVSFPPGLQNVF